jgi:hypothetical protein
VAGNPVGRQLFTKPLVARDDDYVRKLL